MSNKQIEKLTDQLLSYLDKVLEKGDATPIETEALYKIASVLVEIAKLN